MILTEAQPPSLWPISRSRMRRSRGRYGRGLGLVLLLACAACERRAGESTGPRLPEGVAGEILQRAITAAGGWQRWTAARDVAFVTTFTLFDPVGNPTSESIGLHKSPLHGSPRVRLESLGLPEPFTLGFDGTEAWMLHDGAAVRDPDRLQLPRFNMVSNVFWFSLPFSLAELPATVTDAGEETDQGKRWQRLRVVLAEDAPEAPGDWFVISFDPDTGLIDHVLVHVTAAFLSHEMWLGKWLDYEDHDGLKKERRRQFFPADEQGRVLGNKVAEQLVEDVRFNNGFPDSLFDKPLAAGGGSPT
jgi:hypothetical protein